MEEEQQKKKQELTEKVVEFANSIGAEIVSAPQVYLDKDANVKVASVVFVQEKNEKPQKSDSGEKSAEGSDKAPGKTA